MDLQEKSSLPDSSGIYKIQNLVNFKIYIGSEKAAKEYELINPKGEKVVGKNLTKLAKENNLTRSLISEVMNGNVFQHRGWTKTFENYDILKNYGSFTACTKYKNRGLKPFSIKNLETGNLYTVYSVSKAEKELKISNLYKLKAGKSKTCGKWVLAEDIN